MKARWRLALAAGVALIVTCGALLVFILSRGEMKGGGQVPAETSHVVVGGSEGKGVETPSNPSEPIPLEEKQSPEVLSEEPGEQVTGNEEKPIEEELAERGEDPGAVFYMSRVREALKEGNPRFARELLRQMREAHSQSVLVKAAEDLFVESR